ncbi:Protein of unknown function [Polaromonas sp. OV174]|uniref:DUF3168 domain-containing protein n=1 Tax=Polaromonas sp. OV174 TaxID=1855300 RepID=UPI0008E47CC6|nr:DUF3168 domain-containing protein [Polaromonas sp. OV174]SFB74145.1 Protein of unknown function [Polaromonas sp. OV174]
MSAEATLFAVLRALVADRVYPDVAPEGSALPRIVYQQAGGEVIAYMEGTLPDKENGRMQIVCWATTRIAAVNLAKQVEAAILSAPVIQADALGARVSVYEEDTKLFGSRQDFSIWSTR